MIARGRVHLSRGERGGAARCPSCSQNAHDKNVLAWEKSASRRARLAPPTLLGGFRDVVHTPCEIDQGGLGLVESLGELRIHHADHPSYDKVFILGENPRVL